MKKKADSVFVCRECGAEHPRWTGRCRSCNSWNSVAESRGTPTVSAGRGPGAEPLLSLAEVVGVKETRLSSGLADIDLVLGGGFVPGSLILVAGEPGVGKSTLLLELARSAPAGFVYFCGEEAPAQIGSRAQRLGLRDQDLRLSRQSDPEALARFILQTRPPLVAIDSIQTLSRSGTSGMPGLVGQLREATMILLDAARAAGTTVIVTGHVTKEGNLAGPRMIEHMMDVVLYLESDRLNHFRILRASKNRFGPVGEVALFEMGAAGLRSLSGLDIARSDANAPGRVCSVLLEGSRPITVEVQALVCRSTPGPPRRVAEGLDTRRLTLIAAVLEKFLKVRLTECDIFANLAGGLDADEPALDLAVSVAILSSLRDTSVPQGLACLGEVGLSGEVRAVARLAPRILDLERLGFKSLVLPDADRESLPVSRLGLRPVSHVGELIGRVFGDSGCASNREAIRCAE